MVRLDRRQTQEHKQRAKSRTLTHLTSAFAATETTHKIKGLLVQQTRQTILLAMMCSISLLVKTTLLNSCLFFSQIGFCFECCLSCYLDCFSLFFDWLLLSLLSDLILLVRYRKQFVVDALLEPNQRVSFIVVDRWHDEEYTCKRCHFCEGFPLAPTHF